MNVKTPAEVISNSDPETVKMTLSPSASVAVTVPMADWFSAALKVADELISGEWLFPEPKTTFVLKPKEFNSATWYCLLLSALSLIKIYETF